MMRALEHPCPACGGAQVDVFYEQRAVPVHSCLLIDDRAEAERFPTGDLVLGSCPACGFVTNTAFDASVHRYSERYEETQGFSPTFQAFASDLAQRWIDRYDLRGRHLIEIGCGKGEFLHLICELGGNTGLGIDPSWVPDRLGSDDRVRFEQVFYGDAYGPLEADAVICRHTLEHIAPVQEFLRTVRRGLGDRTDTVVLFELPDLRCVLEEANFWDVYYEHCSYFTEGSLARAFELAGFTLLDVSRDFDDQYLLVEALPATAAGPAGAFTPADDVEDVRLLAAVYADAVRERVAGLRGTVERAAAAGRRVAVWGSGSKGVAFLTSLDLSDEVAYVVDINPHKQGKYMAGTGHLVVGPHDLASCPPDLVVVMNPVYQEEIATCLARMGLASELVGL